MNITRGIVLVAVLQLALVGALVWASPAMVQAQADPASSFATTPVAPGALPQLTPNSSNIRNILSIVFGIIGSLAVLMMVISGLKYITSAGDAQKISEAKNSILYALIGLITAILAEAIVAYVIKRTP